MTRSKALIGTALLAALSGCAAKAPPPVAKPAPPPPAPLPMRIGVLPPDALFMPDVAAALSERLAHARAVSAPSAAAELEVTADVVTAKVSMEVAQLSLECVSPTNDCYVAVGKFLQVDRLLWGQVGHGDGLTDVKITVVFLDVGRAAALGRVERMFPEAAAAIAGMDEVIDQATGREPRFAPAVAAAPREQP